MVQINRMVFYNFLLMECVSFCFTVVREANVPIYIIHHHNLHAMRDDFAMLSQHSAKFIKEFVDKMFGTTNISPLNDIDTYFRS